MGARQKQWYDIGPPCESGEFERIELEDRMRSKIQWPTVVVAGLAIVGGVVLLALDAGAEHATALFGLAIGAVTTRRIVE